MPVEAFALFQHEYHGCSQVAVTNSQKTAPRKKKRPSNVTKKLTVEEKQTRQHYDFTQCSKVPFYLIKGRSLWTVWGAGGQTHF